MTEQPAVSVRRNEQAHRYEAELDGAIAGFIDYHLRDGHPVLIHTETDPAFGGRGVGTALVTSALADIRVRGEKAIVICPFIKAYLAKHPGEYDDVILRVE